MTLRSTDNPKRLVAAADELDDSKPTIVPSRSRRRQTQQQNNYAQEEHDNTIIVCLLILFICECVSMCMQPHKYFRVGVTQQTVHSLWKPRPASRSS